MNTSDGGFVEIADRDPVSEHSHAPVHLPQSLNVLSSSSVEVTADGTITCSVVEEGFDTKEREAVEFVARAELAFADRLFSRTVDVVLERRRSCMFSA